MITISKFVVIAVGLVAGSSASADYVNGTHCVGKEAVIFSCTIGVTVVSICGVSTNHTPAFLEYRHGMLGQAKLSIPSGTDMTSSRALVYANAIGDGNGYIHFVKGDKSYTAYHFSSRGSQPKDGSAPGWRHSDGVLVEREGKKIAHLRCPNTGQADFDPTRIYKQWGMLSPDHDATDDLMLRKLHAIARP